MTPRIHPPSNAGHNWLTVFAATAEELRDFLNAVPRLEPLPAFLAQALHAIHRPRQTQGFSVRDATRCQATAHYFTPVSVGDFVAALLAERFPHLRFRLEFYAPMLALAGRIEWADGRPVGAWSTHVEPPKAPPAFEMSTVGPREGCHPCVALAVGL